MPAIKPIKIVFFINDFDFYKWYTILSKLAFKNFLIAKKEANELATVKVYLNTSIIAILLGVGFLASTLIFGVLFIALK